MKVNFLNTQVDNISMEESLKKIEKFIQQKKNAYVVTPNVDHIVRIESDLEFGNAYKKADLVLVDGQILIWVAKLLKKPIQDKVSGSDLFPRLCALSGRKKYKIFLLGAGPGVAEYAAKVIKEKYEGDVCGVYSPPFGFEKNAEEIEKIISTIRAVKPDILVVGLGAPKQEKFMAEYKERLGVPVSLGLGASIDFMAGNVKRAPIWIQKCGLEWFFRFLSEPKRLFKRYFIDDIKIIKIIWKYRKT